VRQVGYLLELVLARHFQRFSIFSTRSSFNPKLYLVPTGGSSGVVFRSFVVWFWPLVHTVLGFYTL